MSATRVDAIIIGGGAAGLWTLDALTRRGYAAVLLERTALGDGQTVWSQGILHGGLKYSLKGLVTGAAASIRDMPGLWRSSLSGDGEPDLSAVRVRSEHCWVWQTKGLGSRVGMLGARAGLRVAPEVVERADRPSALRDCPGIVAKLGEQVIDPVSLLVALAAGHEARVLRVDPTPGLYRAENGIRVEIGGGRAIEARSVVLCAGNGNASLRERLGLDPDIQQVRPLRMVMARGDLPDLNGHCVDLAHTRVTITSDVDASGRRVWQIGGEVAERGATLDETETIRRARTELADVLPGLGLGAVEWATYWAPRAEGRTPGGGRPDDCVVRIEKCVVTAWPTKLVLVPVLAERVCAAVERICGKASGGEPIVIEDAEPARVAKAPWEADADWIPGERVASHES